MLVNKETPLQYIAAMQISRVNCLGCDNTIELNATVFQIGEAHAAAMQAHTEAVLICPRREFVITYAPQLIDKRIIDDAAKGIIQVDAKA